MGKKYIKAVGRFFEPSEGESDRMAAGEDKATASHADLLTKCSGPTLIGPEPPKVLVNSSRTALNYDPRISHSVHQIYQMMSAELSKKQDDRLLGGASFFLLP